MFETGYEWLDEPEAFVIINRNTGKFIDLVWSYEEANMICCHDSGVCMKIFRKVGE